MQTKAINCTHVYPSGWVASGVGCMTATPKVIDSAGDVSEIYNRVMLRHSQEISGRDIVAITALATKYLGGDAVALNLTSTHLTDTSRQFLVDSLNFAVTGHRSVSVYLATTLMNSHEVGNVIDGPHSDSRFDDLHTDVKSAKSIEPIILRWAQQPNGIFDIICTLNSLL